MRADRPAARMSSTLSLRTWAGVMRRESAEKRSHTDCAAFTEICCPTMLRASVTKASPRDCRHTPGCCGISFFMTRSRFMRWRQASTQ